MRSCVSNQLQCSTASSSRFFKWKLILEKKDDLGLWLTERWQLLSVMDLRVAGKFTMPTLLESTYASCMHKLSIFGHLTLIFSIKFSVTVWFFHLSNGYNDTWPRIFNVRISPDWQTSRKRKWSNCEQLIGFDVKSTFAQCVWSCAKVRRRVQVLCVCVREKI